MAAAQVDSPAGSSIVTDEVIADLTTRVRGQVIAPGDADYERARRVWNGMIDKRPGVIVRCTGTADVVAAVNVAREHALPLAVRGGGHNVAGNAVCNDGLVIDLSQMKGIHVDPLKRSVRAQGGVTWGELDRETQLHGLVTPGGEVSMTGIAGYTLSGGMGLLQRKWGLACDNLLAAEIVTAAGEVLHASATEHPDLFWAVRGGGGNFGVVTWFEFQLYELGPEIYSAATIYAADDATAVLRQWCDFTAHAPDEITSQVLFWGMPPLPDVPEEMVGAPIVIVAGMYAGPVEEGERMMAPLREFATPIADLSGVSSYVESQSAFDELFPDGQQYYWKSTYLDHLDDATIELIVGLGQERTSPMTLFALRHLGGAVSQLPDDATAYGNRRALYNLSIDSTWQDPSENEGHIAWTRAAWSQVREQAGGGIYLNFAGLGEENDVLAHAGYGTNYARLQQVKRRYDPTNLFRGNVNVTV
jgi:FAD/FMN-containing dehydrogenase